MKLVRDNSRICCFFSPKNKRKLKRMVVLSDGQLASPNLRLYYFSPNLHFWVLEMIIFIVHTRPMESRRTWASVAGTSFRFWYFVPLLNQPRWLQHFQQQFDILPKQSKGVFIGNFNFIPDWNLKTPKTGKMLWASNSRTQEVELRRFWVWGSPGICNKTLKENPSLYTRLIVFRQMYHIPSVVSRIPSW